MLSSLIDVMTGYRSVLPTGVRGALKSLYYSSRHTKSLTKVIFHSNVVSDISAQATFKISNRLSIGISNMGASHPRQMRSVFRVCEDGSIMHTGKKSATIGPGSVVHVEGKFSMGDSYINSHCRIICGDEITIGDGVAIAWNVEILDDDRHEITGSNRTAPIVIEDNVWIGHDVSITKGTTIGEGAVIANDSVVTEDIPPQSLCGGYPAKVIKKNVDWS